ncbi:hypothetical protein D3C73_918440 [compost metagenome]
MVAVRHIEGVIAEYGRTVGCRAAGPEAGGRFIFIVEHIVVEIIRHALEISGRQIGIRVGELGYRPVIDEHIVEEVRCRGVDIEPAEFDQIAGIVIADVIAGDIIAAPPQIRHPAHRIVMRIIELVDNVHVRRIKVECRSVAVIGPGSRRPAVHLIVLEHDIV